MASDSRAISCKAARRGSGAWERALRGPSTPHAGSRGFGIGTKGDAIGHPMKPGAEGVINPDRARSSHQDEENGLECVLSGRFVAQDAPTDGQNHRPMPRHESRERRFITGGAIAAKQGSVRQAAVHAGDKQPAICGKMAGGAWRKSLKIRGVAPLASYRCTEGP